MLARWYAYIGRRRLLIGLGSAVAVTLAAAIPGVIAGSGSSTHVHSASAVPAAGEASIVQPPPPGVVTATDLQAPGGGPTTSVPPPPTTTPPAVLGFQATRIVGRAPAPAAATPTTARHCRNSTDPACGPFSWDPNPGPNQPLTGQVTAAPASPSAGQTVTFHITASDPDASPVVVCGTFFGDGADIVCDPGPKVNPGTCPKQYGPWTPPARQQGALDTTVQHTYQKAGTYEASFQVNSAQEACNNPYASSTVVKVTVVVTPSPT